jgi:hypothetical protein
MADDGDLPPEARRVLLEGYDLDALQRERGLTNTAIRRHEAIAAVLRDLRDGLIDDSTARLRLFRIAPNHYPIPRGDEP